MPEFLEATFDKFIFRVKDGYLYHPDELWVHIQESLATVGLTDFLQKTKGDIIFLETVAPGTIVRQGEEIGKIETIKAVEALLSPVSGKVVKINPGRWQKTLISSMKTLIKLDGSIKLS